MVTLSVEVKQSCLCCAGLPWLNYAASFLCFLKELLAEEEIEWKTNGSEGAGCLETLESPRNSLFSLLNEVRLQNLKVALRNEAAGFCY